MRSTPEPRKIIAVVGILALAAVMVTVLLVSLSRRQNVRQGVQVEVPQTQTTPGSVDAQDFLIPDEARRITTWSWKLHRQPGVPWDEKEASRFWISPDRIGLDYLIEENDALVDSLLERVP